MHRDRHRLDDVYDALSHATRRAVLRYLTEADAPVSLDVLAAATRRELDRDGVVADDEALRVGLVHAHLPKLADVGLVEWDGHTVALSPGVDGRRISPALDDDRLDFAGTRRESSP